MVINEKGIKLGDKVVINNSDYSKDLFTVGNVYRVIELMEDSVGLADNFGRGDGLSDLGGWCFYNEEVDLVKINTNNP